MELLETLFNGRVRYYQLDFKVRNVKAGVNGGWDTTIKELFEADPIRLIEPWVLDEDISESVDKIAISDATTHIERLVFPCFYIKNTKTGERKLWHRTTNIHGKHTMMIHGGDRRSAYSPKTYERALRAIQKENVNA